MEKQYHSIFKQIGKNRFYTACNTTCTGRIKNGSEFFCGDGKVQKKSGDTSGCGTNGANCVEVTGKGSSQYPGPGWTGDASTFTSEACDFNDTKNSGSTKLTTNKLCNLAKGTNYSDYTENSTITCSDSCTINNANRCARCGNNTKEYGEECDGGTTATLCSGAGKTYYNKNPITKTLNFGYVDNSTIKIETATITKNSSNVNANGWNLQSGNQRSGSNALCARNWNDASSSNEIEFSIKPPASGQICFWWKGESESCCDKFTYTFNGTQRFQKGGSFSTYQQQCEDVTAGSTYTFSFKYTKDGGADTGIDRFCIDDITIPANPTLSSDPSDRACNSSCKTTGECNSYCGDSVTHVNYEACDDGSSNSDDYGDHCNATCTGKAPFCGDEQVTEGEACDGNSTDCSNVGDYNQGTATCTASCTWDKTNCSKSSGGC